MGEMIKLEAIAKSAPSFREGDAVRGGDFHIPLDVVGVDDGKFIGLVSAKDFYVTFPFVLPIFTEDKLIVYIPKSGMGPSRRNWYFEPKPAEIIEVLNAKGEVRAVYCRSYDSNQKVKPA